MSPQKMVDLAIAEWMGLTAAECAERLGVSPPGNWKRQEVTGLSGDT